MKQFIRICILVTVIMFCAGVVNVSASVYYVNNKGVEMTELEYVKMTSIFSEKKVAILTQEEFDQFKGSTIVSNGAVYEKSTYVNGKFSSSEMITEEEFNNASTAKVTPGGNTRDSDSSYIETSYKKLTGSLVDNGSYFMLVGNVLWKIMPVTKSYDIFAYWVQHFDYSGFTGTQIYTIGGTNYYIDYTTASEGYKAQDIGAGVSMNLKDGDTITEYDLTIVTTLYVNTSSYSQAHAFLSYQHAQADLTRAQSMGYTLDIMGLGSVVYFSDTSIRNKYDGMSGLHLTTPI